VHTVIGGLQHGIRWLRHEVAAAKRQAFHIANVIEHPFSGPIRAGVIAGLKPLVGELRGLERWTLPRVRTLEHDITTVIPRDIAELRARDLSLSRLYNRLWRLARRDAAKLGAITFAGAVAIALSRLGAGWIRCQPFRKNASRLCRLDPSLFGDFLGLLADFLVLENICQVIPWLETGFADVGGPIIDLLTRAGAGICDSGYAQTPALAVPPLSLPAAPSLTLHLP